MPPYLQPETMTEAYEGPGRLVNSGPFNGQGNEAAKEAITRHLLKKGWAGKKIQYRLRDWGVSRQRYWGAPIPMIYCDRCGIVPVPEEDLPVLLPLEAEITPAGGSPLPFLKEFIETRCPKCQGPGRRETDTMDTFVESSWYFDRYTCPDYHQGPLDSSRVGLLDAGGSIYRRDRTCGPASSLFPFFYQGPPGSGLAEGG